MKQTEPQWYTTWFDTKYYHTLYKHRNFDEAKDFMNALTSTLQLKHNAHILDVACGRGRHAVYLNKIGYEVTGIDLSENNINFAKSFENERLRFKKHDMCEPMPMAFDAIVNLFTSFGYFENDADNFRAIKTMAENLKQQGTGVIDFLNIHKTIDTLKANEIKEIDGINFNISKSVENGYIIKKINFEADNQSHHFEEKLKCLDLFTFEKYFKNANLEVSEVFGDYNLNPYDKKTSDRLIMIFSHKK